MPMYKRRTLTVRRRYPVKRSAYNLRSYAKKAYNPRIYKKRVYPSARSYLPLYRKTRR